MTRDRMFGPGRLAWFLLIVCIGCSEEVLLVDGLSPAEANALSARLRQANLHPQSRVTPSQRRGIVIPVAEVPAATHILMIPDHRPVEPWLPTPASIHRDRERELSRRLTSLASALPDVSAASIHVHLPSPPRFRGLVPNPPQVVASLSTAPPAERENLTRDFGALLATFPLLENAELTLRWAGASESLAPTNSRLAQVGPFLVAPGHASWLRVTFAVGLLALIWATSSLLFLLFPRLSRHRA